MEHIKPGMICDQLLSGVERLSNLRIVIKLNYSLFKKKCLNRKICVPKLVEELFYIQLLS
jgi:hypothetical protein